MTEVDMRQCWKCGEQTPADDPYCQHCGTDRWTSKQRPRDGAPIRADAITPEKTTAAGVWLIATAMLLTFWFWAAILAMVIFWRDDRTVLDAGRLLPAAAASVVMTIASWAFGYKVIEAG